MLKTFKISLLLIGFTVFHNAFALTWYDVLPEEVIFIRADGRAGFQGYYISFIKDIPGDEGCTPRDFAYIPNNNALSKEMYATLLTAISSGKKITIATNGCDSIGNIIDAIALIR